MCAWSDLPLATRFAIARKNPDREVIFFGLGFETTMPSTAMTVIQARRRNVTNFSLFCNHITIIPTIKAILDAPDLQLDGFLGPGHVSMVIGTGIYDFISSHYRKPIAIAGFEPLDVLQSLWMVLKREIIEGHARLETKRQGRVRYAAERQPGRPGTRSMRSGELREFFEWQVPQLDRGPFSACGCVKIRRVRRRTVKVRAVPNISIAGPKGGASGGEVLRKGLIIKIRTSAG